MATIPNQATGLRHVRKTIAFDGTANNGRLGDDVPCFSTTGRVLALFFAPYISEALVCSAPTLTQIYLAVGAAGFPANIATGGWDFTGSTGVPDNGNEQIAASGDTANRDSAKVITGNIVLRILDNGGGADITDGTIIVDCWYYPITDDGALAGDDIDLELGAYLADKVLDEALSGHTTAGTLGKAVADVETDVDAVLVDTGTTLQAELDGIQAATEDIQTRLPAALVGGRIDATIDATGMEAGAIDAILTRQMTEAYAADGAAPTLAQALFEIMQCLTEFAISGTTITVKKRDGTTTAMTFTLDSATVPTSRTRAT
jgi:hypothetical protein